MLLGWQKNPYLHIKQSNFFVLLTKYEGFCYSIIESQCLKVPVLISDVDFGPREIIQDGVNGVLIKNHTSQNVATKLIEIINKKDVFLNLIKEGYKTANKYDKSRIYPLYRSVFKDIDSCA